VHFQRAGVAVNPAGRRLLNGPRRVRSKALAEYFATWRHTSVARNMLVFC